MSVNRIKDKVKSSKGVDASGGSYFSLPPGAKHSHFENDGGRSNAYFSHNEDSTREPATSARKIGTNQSASFEHQYVCISCGCSWEKPIELDYHLNHAATLCGAGYPVPEPKSDTKRKRDSFNNVVAEGGAQSALNEYPDEGLFEVTGFTGEYSSGGGMPTKKHRVLSAPNTIEGFDISQSSVQDHEFNDNYDVIRQLQEAAESSMPAPDHLQHDNVLPRHSPQVALGVQQTHSLAQVLLNPIDPVLIDPALIDPALIDPALIDPALRDWAPASNLSQEAPKLTHSSSVTASCVPNAAHSEFQRQTGSGVLSKRELAYDSSPRSALYANQAIDHAGTMISSYETHRPTAPYLNNPAKVAASSSSPAKTPRILGATKRVRGDGGKSLPFKCKTCPGQWGTTQGLKWHLKKANHLCNPSSELAKEAALAQSSALHSQKNMAASVTDRGLLTIKMPGLFSRLEEMYGQIFDGNPFANAVTDLVREKPRRAPEADCTAQSVQEAPPEGRPVPATTCDTSPSEQALRLQQTALTFAPSQSYMSTTSSTGSSFIFQPLAPPFGRVTMDAVIGQQEPDPRLQILSKPHAEDSQMMEVTGAYHDGLPPFIRTHTKSHTAANASAEPFIQPAVFIPPTPEVQSRLMIAISGPPHSGKSTIALLLRYLLSAVTKTIIVEQDDYLKPPNECLATCWVDPSEHDFNIYHREAMQMGYDQMSKEWVDGNAGETGIPPGAYMLPEGQEYVYWHPTDVGNKVKAKMEARMEQGIAYEAETILRHGPDRHDWSAFDWESLFTALCKLKVGNNFVDDTEKSADDDIKLREAFNLVGMQKMTELRQTLVDCIQVEHSFNIEAGFDGHYIVHGKLRPVGLVDGSTLYIDPQLGPVGEKAMEVFNCKMFLPQTRNTVYMRRFTSEEYSLERIARHPGLGVLTEEYFDGIVWKHYEEYHNWLMDPLPDGLGITRSQRGLASDVIVQADFNAGIAEVIQWAMEVVIIEIQSTETMQRRSWLQAKEENRIAIAQSSKLDPRMADW